MDDLVISIGHVGRDFEMLEKCLGTVFAEESQDFHFQVVIVYNGPDDPARADRIAAAFPQVRMIYRPGPLGFCLTHNLVLRQCEARYALVLDDDTLVAPGTLENMVAFMDEHPRVGMAGCKTLNPDGTFQRTFGLLPSLTTEVLSLVRRGVYWPDSLYVDQSHVREVPWLNGSFMLVRAQTMREVGVLDEHYYTYFCESDWAYRMTDAGWSVAFVPDCEITHVGGEHSINTGERRPIQIVRSYANRFYYFRQHLSATAFALLRPVSILASLFRIVLYAGVFLMRPESRSLSRLRIESYLEVIRLCFDATPHVLPQRIVDAEARHQAGEAGRGEDMAGRPAT